MKAVIDTNVLISGVFWSGTPARILEHWSQGSFEMAVSEPILQEYRRVLVEISAGRRHDLVQRWLLHIARYAQVVSIDAHVHLSVDPDDDKFIECALASKAQYVVSGDRHLLTLNRVGSVAIANPAHFLTLLNERSRAT